MAGVDCKGMCDVADMSLAPPLPSPAAITAASACLTTPGVECACPLQGGYMTFVSGGTVSLSRLLCRPFAPRGHVMRVGVAGSCHRG
jgi:hypothetical protein